jgi:hypothetical protein
MIYESADSSQRGQINLMNADILHDVKYLLRMNNISLAAIDNTSGFFKRTAVKKGVFGIDYTPN